MSSMSSTAKQRWRRPRVLAGRGCAELAEERHGGVEVVDDADVIHPENGHVGGDAGIRGYGDAGMWKGLCARVARALF